MKKSIKHLHLDVRDLRPSNRIPLTNYVDDKGNEVYEKLVIAEPNYCFYLFLSNYSLPEKCYSKGYAYIANRPCYFIRLDEFKFPTIIFMLRRIDGIESFILMKDGSEIFNKSQVIYAFNKDDFKEKFNNVAIDERCSRCELYYPAKYDKHINDFVYEHVKSLKPLKPGFMSIDDKSFNEPYSFLWSWYSNRNNVEEPTPFVMLSPKSRLYNDFVREPSPIKPSPHKPSMITRKMRVELSDDDSDFVNELNADVPKFVHNQRLYQREVIKNNIARKERERQLMNVYERQLRNREREQQTDSFTPLTETSMILTDSRFFSPIRPSMKPPPPPIKQRKIFDDLTLDKTEITFFNDSPPSSSDEGESSLRIEMPKFRK